MKQIAANNVDFIHNSDDYNYKTVIINTCGFINNAKEESIDTILRFVKAKSQGKIENVFVIGCLSQRYKDDLIKEIPEVDEYFGVNDLCKILEKLGIQYYRNLLGERYISTPRHYAYLKISEGCDRSCSFCAIPLIRGKYVSKPAEVIISEAQSIAKLGVKELIIIAQDLTYYGFDKTNKPEIIPLLEKILLINGIDWIRLHYAYPANFPVELLSVIANNQRICKYIDLPIQHISDPMLLKMRRGITREKTIRLLELIRKKLPGAAVRTTLLVGHPGETEKDFFELLAFVKDYQFERLGVFEYSEENDTYSAQQYTDDVPAKEKKLRSSEIMKIQKGISIKKNQEKTGCNIKVIIDRKEGELYIGRTEFDSPEVDNEVIINPGNQVVEIGNFYQVKVLSSDEYDLSGSIEG